MKAFFSQLGERERLLLLIAGPLLLLLLVYGLLWRPFDQRIEGLQQRVAEQQSLVQWMQASAQQVAQLRRQPALRQGGARSLLSVVDSTIRQSGLSRALKQVDPDGADKVKVRLEQAEFDVIITWLETLQSRYAITVQNISVDRQDSPGIVTVRLSLVGAAS